MRVPESAREYPQNTWEHYWRLCLSVVDAAGTLASRDKLLMTYRDKSKSASVEDVIKKYYDGDPEKVKSARIDAATSFWRAIDQVNHFACEHDLNQVSAMTLLGLLEDEKARRKFRHHIRHHIKTRHPPFELDELPVRDFRKNHESR